MIFTHPDLESFRGYFETEVRTINGLSTNTPQDLKIRSILNLYVYVMATRFIEGSIKHVLVSCCVLRGDTDTTLLENINRINSFNDPMFSKTRKLFLELVNFDISNGQKDGWFDNGDVSLYNEVVKNRHNNVHARHDQAAWSNTNIKDIKEFPREYKSILKIIKYFDSLRYCCDLTRFQIEAYDIDSVKNYAIF